MIYQSIETLAFEYLLSVGYSKQQAQYHIACEEGLLEHLAEHVEATV